MAAISEFWFDLQVVLALRSLDSFLDQLRSAIGGRTWPAVRGFASPSPTTPRLKPAPESNLEALLGKLSAIAKDPRDVTIGFGEMSKLTWGQRPDGQTFYVSLSLAPKDNLFDDPAESVRALTHVARGLLGHGSVASAAVERQGDAAACVPFVPIAKTRRPLVVTTDAEVAEAYERVDEFWAAGWEVQRFADQRLLTRCQNAVSKADVLRETQDYQWQMARAAKAGRTKYATPVVTPEEKPMYEAGEPRLQPVGRNRQTGLVEYSCVLQQGEHLRGFEIYYLRSLVANKKMQDGTPVSAVQVVFLEQWMAQCEKRPLLDNGVQVFYEDSSTGDLVAVTE